MKTGILALALAATMAWPAQAALTPPGADRNLEDKTAPTPAPEALRLAHEFLLVVSPPDQLEEQLIAQLKGYTLMMPGMQDASIPSNDKLINTALDAGRPAIHRHIADITEAYARAYARRFSPAEMDQIIAFVRTPTGLRLFTEGDKLVLDTDVISASRGALEEATAAIIESAQKEACKRQTAKRIAAGDTKAKCPLA
jgi:hypothetical protein